MLDALPKRQASAERTAEGQEAVPELEAVWQEAAEDHLRAASKSTVTPLSSNERFCQTAYRRKSV